LRGPRGSSSDVRTDHKYVFEAGTVPASRRGGWRKGSARSRIGTNVTRACHAEDRETYRTTKALRELVRRAAKVVDKRPSEFLRQAAEEKARAVLREAAGEDLRKLLARLPPGRAASEAAAERLGEEAAQAVRKGV
jgi:uncharacterized protein (DUF1778 family)